MLACHCTGCEDGFRAAGTAVFRIIEYNIHYPIMIRHLFTFAAFLSLLLLAAAVIVWVRSYTQFEAVLIGWSSQYSPGGRDASGTVWSSMVIHPSMAVKSNSGMLHIGTGWGDWMNHRRKVQIVVKESDNAPAERCFFKFERYPRIRSFPNVPMFSLTVSDFIPTVALAIVPAIWFMRRIRARRGKARWAQ
jgi:hypothetical protein